MSNEIDISPELQTESSGLRFDKRIIWLAYKKKVLFILAASVIVMIIAGIALKINASPVWKAHCFMIKAPKNMSTPVEMPYLYQTFDIYTVLETVKIREVMDEVIRRLELKTTPEKLNRSIEVQRGNRSAVLRFTATWHDKQLAAQIANATAEAFIANSNKLMNSATQKIYDYYVAERQARLQTISELEIQHAEHRQEYGVISIPQETQVKFDQLKEVEIRMIANRLRITEMDSKIAEMNQKLSGVPPQTQLSWTYTQTDETRMLELQRELELLRSRYTEENPKVIKVLQDIEELRRLMQNQDRDLPEAITWGPSGLLDVYTIDRSRFEAERQASLQMDTEYRVKIDSLRANLGTLTDVQKEFLEIERQLQLNRDVLRIIEARLAEAQMSIQSNISDYEIIEPASPPLFPESTRLKLIVVGLGILVFVLGSIGVIGREILDQHLKSPKDFNHSSMMPLLAQIPDENQFENHIYLKNLQVLGDNILRLLQGKENSVLCFGSDIPETGKSFLITDLIRLFQTRGIKLLYIDSIRESNSDTQAYLLNGWIYDNNKTIQVSGNNSQEHCAYFHTDERIFTHLVDRNQFVELFDQLKQYDLIIWELFDYEYNKQLFATISSAADALILVGRFNRSGRASMAKIKKYLNERNYDNVYGVLNNVPKDYFKDEL